jgi:hypothetical protein
MSPTVPVGDPASRPEKVAPFVSRSDPRATAVVDELNAFSSERSLSTETRSLEKASAGTLHRPTSEPSSSRWPLIVSAAAGAVALIVSGIFFGPSLFNLSESGGPALKPGRVTIGTTPLGAMVMVDGVSRGLTPITIQLDPELTPSSFSGAPSGARWRFRWPRARNSTQHYEFAAEPPSALSTVNITTDPAGARVLVDGEPRAHRRCR